MRTRQSYLAAAQRRKDKFARARKRKEEIRSLQPPADYPPIIIAGTLLKSITLRDHLRQSVTVIELRKAARGRSDQFSVSVDGRQWPKHGRAVGISVIRRAIA